MIKEESITAPEITGNTREPDPVPLSNNIKQATDDVKQAAGLTSSNAVANGDSVNVEKMLQVFQQLASQQGTQQGNLISSRSIYLFIVASGIQQQLLQQQVMQQLQLQQAVAAVQGLQKQLQDQFELARNLVRDLQNSSPKSNQSQPAGSPITGNNSGNNSNGNSPGSRGQDGGPMRNQSQSCRSMLPYSSNSPNSRNQNSGDLMSNPNPAGSLLRPQHGLPPLAARGRPHFHPGQMDDSIQVFIHRIMYYVSMRKKVHLFHFEYFDPRRI